MGLQPYQSCIERRAPAGARRGSWRRVACGHDHGPPRVRSPPASGCVSRAARRRPTPRSSRIANYKIDAKLDAGAPPVITATETLTWTNAGDSAVDTLPFHLYLNAFKNETSLFMRTSRGDDARRAHASDSGWGWIERRLGARSAAASSSPARLTPERSRRDRRRADAADAGRSRARDRGRRSSSPSSCPRCSRAPATRASSTWSGSGSRRSACASGRPAPSAGSASRSHVNSEFFADFGTYDVTLTVPSDPRRSRRPAC